MTELQGGLVRLILVCAFIRNRHAYVLARFWAEETQTD
jgi:hypothetical protein